MTLEHPLIYIARLEAKALLHTPRMWVAALVVAVLPLIYSVIYLSSVWDPLSHSQELKVALVNMDKGFSTPNTLVNVGNLVIESLKKNQRFTYVELEDSEQAKHLVRQGVYAFALIIPSDFSSHAVPGEQAGDGKLVIYSSDGNYYQTALLARQFASELSHAVNEQLNEQRWSFVLQNAIGSERKVEQLHQALNSLRSGAHEINQGSSKAAQAAQTLASGSERLDEGVNQLTDGMRQLGKGIRTMDSRRVRTSDLNRLRSGAEELAQGHVELSQGLEKLHAGGQTILGKVQEYQATLDDSLLAPTAMKEGGKQLQSALIDLNQGISSAQNGQKQLAAGAEKVSTGVNSLVSGMQAMRNGIHTMAEKLPEDKQLDELNEGSGQVASGNNELAKGLYTLRTGTAQLSNGLNALTEALPADMTKPSGSPEGMANSVQPVLEAVAPVPNSGHGLAPNLLPAALWLGANIALFLVNLGVIPRTARHSSRAYLLLGKLSAPAALVLLQSLFLYAAAEDVLHVHIAHPMAFLMTLIITGWCFLCIVAMLTKLLGDAGKALSMVLLALQVAASGGVMPVELSGSWYSSISPWLPFTWVVRGIKVCMFDAFEGQWQIPILIGGAWGLGALVLTMWLGRWRFVSHRSIHPAVNI